MKLWQKILLLSLFVVFAPLCKAQQKIDADTCFKNLIFSKHCIAVMNPTTANIKTLFFLIDNKILELPDSTQIIGIYHKRQKFDFSKTEKYIAENNIQNVKIFGFDANLTPENIYQNNDCSSFYKYIFEHTQGVFLFGGSDIPAQCFADKTLLLTDTSDPYRNFFELSFVFHLIGGRQNNAKEALMKLNPNYIVAGFCLGMQTINCAAGGNLTQDIPTQIYGLSTVEQTLENEKLMHKNYNSYFDYDDKLVSYVFHKINIKNKSALSKIADGCKPYVLSSHHQAVNFLGKNLQTIATTEDGNIIEAVAHTLFPHVIGVQFHPEHTSLYRSDAFFKIKSEDKDEQSYLSLYGGNKGENFHRAFWRQISDWLKN